MKNKFKINNYTGSHEFSCVRCEHFVKPDNWPDVKRNIRCRKHGKKLSFLLNSDGFLIHDEWFCKDIASKQFPDFHINEFKKIREQLKPDYMYHLTRENIEEVSIKKMGTD